MTRSNGRADDEEFVRAWQTAATLAEAAEAAGMEPRAASDRACHMRSLGVGLKKFGDGGRKMDAARLAEVAREVAAGKAAGKKGSQR